MKAKDLIKQLKKMPQDLDVYFSSHDNEIWEVQGKSKEVFHYKKKDHIDFVKRYFDKEDVDMLNHMPDEWVTIHC